MLFSNDLDFELYCECNRLARSFDLNVIGMHHQTKPILALTALVKGKITTLLKPNEHAYKHCLGGNPLLI